MTWWFNEQKYSVIHHATCSAFYYSFQRIKFIFVSYEFPDKLGLIEREKKVCWPPLPVICHNSCLNECGI